MQQDLRRPIPLVIVQAESLQELWAATFLAQIETKTGAITLVNSKPRKRAKKRRRIEESEADVEVKLGQQEQAGDFPAMDNGGDFDFEQGNFFEGEDFGAMSTFSGGIHAKANLPWLDGEDGGGPFNINESRIRSSEVCPTCDHLVPY